MTFGHIGPRTVVWIGRIERSLGAPSSVREQKVPMLHRFTVLSGFLALPLLAVVASGEMACSSGASAPSSAAIGPVDGSVAVSAGNDAGAQGQGPAPANDDAGSQSPSSGGDAGPDLDMQASDFDCILTWPKVGDYRVTNKLGNLSGAVAVANAADGGVFPVGTVVQLIPNEAMVKRYAGFNASSDDWEFFNLTTSATGTVINQRGGGASVTNFTGSSCLNCHSGAAPQWNMICGTTHGCAPLPISETTIQSIQSGDPRCAGVDGG